MCAGSAPIPAVEVDTLPRRLRNLLRNAPQRLRESVVVVVAPVLARIHLVVIQ
jgi:hypothetical protein